MKTCLVMAVICFILYQTPQVNLNFCRVLYKEATDPSYKPYFEGTPCFVRGSCVSCKYGTPKQDCKDVFVPDGPETFDNVCSKINAALCKKYGDYSIYCQSGSSFFSCQKQGLCGSGALNRLTPILLLATIIINVLM